MRFSFGRQSSLDPIRRSPDHDDALTVPENLDSTMQLLFMACRGDVRGVTDLLNEGIDVNSIDLDGRTGLHIAACEGHVEVVKLLLSRKANIDARDRWGSTVNNHSPLFPQVCLGLRLVHLANNFCSLLASFSLRSQFWLFMLLKRERIPSFFIFTLSVSVHCTL